MPTVGATLPVARNNFKNLPLEVLHHYKQLNSVVAVVPLGAHVNLRFPGLFQNPEAREAFSSLLRTDKLTLPVHETLVKALGSSRQVHIVGMWEGQGSGAQFVSGNGLALKTTGAHPVTFTFPERLPPCLSVLSGASLTVPFTLKGRSTVPTFSITYACPISFLPLNLQGVPDFTFLRGIFSSLFVETNLISSFQIDLVPPSVRSPVSSYAVSLILQPTISDPNFKNFKLQYAYKNSFIDLQHVGKLYCVNTSISYEKDISFSSLPPPRAQNVPPPVTAAAPLSSPQANPQPRVLYSDVLVGAPSSRTQVHLDPPFLGGGFPPPPVHVLRRLPLHSLLLPLPLQMRWRFWDTQCRPYLLRKLQRFDCKWQCPGRNVG